MFRVLEMLQLPVQVELRCIPFRQAEAVFQVVQQVLEAFLTGIRGRFMGKAALQSLAQPHREEVVKLVLRYVAQIQVQTVYFNISLFIIIPGKTVL